MLTSNKTETTPGLSRIPRSHFLSSPLFILTPVRRSRDRYGFTHLGLSNQAYLSNTFICNISGALCEPLKRMWPVGFQTYSNRIPWRNHGHPIRNYLHLSLPIWTIICELWYFLSSIPLWPKRMSLMVWSTFKVLTDQESKMKVPMTLQVPPYQSLVTTCHYLVSLCITHQLQWHVSILNLLKYLQKARQHFDIIPLFRTKTIHKPKDSKTAPDCSASSFCRSSLQPDRTARWNAELQWMTILPYCNMICYLSTTDSHMIRTDIRIFFSRHSALDKLL